MKISETLQGWLRENYGLDGAQALTKAWTTEAYLGNMEPDTYGVFVFKPPENYMDDAVGTWSIGDSNETPPVMRAPCYTMYDKKSSCLLSEQVQDMSRCTYGAWMGCQFNEEFFQQVVQLIYTSHIIVNNLSVRALLIDTMKRHKNKEYTLRLWQSINNLVYLFQKKKISYADMLASFYLLAHEDIGDNFAMADALMAFAELRVPFSVKVSMADQILGVPTLCQRDTPPSLKLPSLCSVGRNLGKVLVQGLLLCSMLPHASASPAVSMGAPMYRTSGDIALTNIFTGLSTISPTTSNQTAAMSLPTVDQLESIPDADSSMHAPAKCIIRLWKNKKNPFTSRYFAEGDDVVKDIRTLDNSVTAKVIQKFGPVRPRKRTDRKRALFVLGGPGTGKSKALKKGIALYNILPDTATYVNTDDVRSELPGYQELIDLGRGSGGYKITDKDAAAKYHHQAKIISSKLYDHAVENNTDIIFDGTGGNAANLAARMRGLQTKGYEVNVIHTQLDAHTAARRAASGLVGRGYRQVPQDVIIESNPGYTHKDIMTHLQQAVPYIDNMSIIDTGSSNTEPVHIIGTTTTLRSTKAAY
jgi:hypothetical protein